MDSISETTKSNFQDAEFIKIEDQDTTDHEKAIYWILENWPDLKKIVVFGAFGGRIDHTLNSIHVLYKYQKLAGPTL